jgi:hypothetical protein
MFRAKSGRSLFFENKWEQLRKTQNIKINMTCGSDFWLKKLYLFLHIFLTFSRENSRLGTSLPMMKSVWSHLKCWRPMFYSVYKCWNAKHFVVYSLLSWKTCNLQATRTKLQYCRTILQCCSQAREHPVWCQKMRWLVNKISRNIPPREGMWRVWWCGSHPRRKLCSLCEVLCFYFRSACLSLCSKFVCTLISLKLWV